MFFADLTSIEIFYSLIFSCKNHLTTVTKTSQILSSGMFSCGGRLDMKSVVVGKTITL